MIEIKKSNKGTDFVMASELREKLGIKTKLKDWFPRMIAYGFIESQDFSQVLKNVRLAQGGYNVKKDWAVHIEMAKHIAMIQRTPQGKAMRTYLLGLDNKVQSGELLNQKQIVALFELCEVLGYVSLQKHFEGEHYKIFDKSNNWWDYRAEMFGQSTDDLKQAMLSMNKKYKNQRQALMQIDKYELLKRVTFDLFKLMGKDDEYALKMGEHMKAICPIVRPYIYNDIDMTLDFRTTAQKEKVVMLRNDIQLKQLAIFN